MKRIIILILLVTASAAAPARTFRLASPDSRQKAVLEVSDVNGKTVISYSTSFDDRPVVLPSVLDLTVDNHIWEKALAKKSSPVEKWFDDFVYDSHELTSRDTTWQNPYGERSVVKDAYNGIVVHFIKKDASGYRLDIEFRAYNEGIAFRYCLSYQS